MIINANALHIPLKDATVQCCVTSPPYYGLRDYGTAKWEGGDPECDHKNGTLQSDKTTLHPGTSQNDKRNFDGMPFRDICGKCGAIRIDDQIGLEPTPDEYVAKLVAVFREVKRVLKDDGVLWLNLGDSYAGSGNGSNDYREDGASLSKNDNKYGTHKPGLAGLKPKDLIGIPWMVAFALRQPYYTGTIRAEKDRIWLASMIDGEGCMYIHKRKTGQNNGQGYERKHDSYGAGLEVANCHESIVRRCLEITGKGSICAVERESRMKNRNQTLYRWNLRSNECRDVIREVYPYFVGKKHEARLVLGCPSSGDLAEKAHIGLMALHNGKECDIDFPEPKSMYEPGWYLRSDVIWAKNNPMPESVKDRPTKAHEYLFLLAKSQKYYYDNEAIFEVATGYDNRKETMYKGGNKDMAGGAHERCTRKNDDTNYGGNGTGFQDHSGYSNLDNPYVRNKRTVWTITTQPFQGAHFAVMPEKLVEPCILAGTSEYGQCPKCGANWVRETVNYGAKKNLHLPLEKAGSTQTGGKLSSTLNGIPSKSITLGWQPSCNCNAGREPNVILDPFAGSGTVGVVAQKLGRGFVGIELNPEYVKLAETRMMDTPVSLFNQSILEEL